MTTAARARVIRSVDELLADARRRLRRLGPHEAAAALAAGGLLIDIRPRLLRAAEGDVPGALPIERNYLEWRLDPGCDARIPEVTDHDQVIVIMCQEGYTSSLAAASLQDMGFVNATDLDGGFAAWRAAGLPTIPAPP